MTMHQYILTYIEIVHVNVKYNCIGVKMFLNQNSLFKVKSVLHIK